MSRRSFNVLMIAPTPFFADYGCHVRILEEARILQKLGHRVVICAYPSGGDVPGLMIERIWDTQDEEVQVGATASAGYKIRCDAFLLFKSLQVAHPFRPDIIHAHLHEGALIGWILGMVMHSLASMRELLLSFSLKQGACDDASARSFSEGVQSHQAPRADASERVRQVRRTPLIFDFQGSLTDEMINHRFLRRDGVFYRPMRRVEWLIDHMPRAIITNSSHASDLLTDEFGCDDGRIHVVPDCVNGDVFSPWWEWGADERTALKTQLGIPPGRQVVVYLGLLAEYQGIRYLLQAARHVIDDTSNEVHFLIMGYPGEDYYRAVARDLGLTGHITFTGRIPYGEAPRYLAAGDVAVAPKLSATEGSGKILTYMALGLPIVAFDVPVSREYLGDLGVYAQAGDHLSLAEAIESLLSDEESAMDLGRRLRERAMRDYSWERAGERILEIYDSLCRRRDDL